jgi:hypothetical protein
LRQPTISDHLKIRHDAGLLDRDKRGVWIDGPYELVVAASASRAIREVLPETAAWAVIDFINGRLLANPRRLGYRARATGGSAHVGGYRVERHRLERPPGRHQPAHRGRPAAQDPPPTPQNPRQPRRHNSSAITLAAPDPR